MKNIIYISTFILLLAVPGIGLFFKSEGQIEKLEQVEKRKFQSWPEYSEDWAKMFIEIDGYIRDRFAFRIYFLRMYSTIHTFLFHESYNGNVLIGKDGWLFINKAEDAEKVTGLYRYDEEYLDAKKKIFFQRADWLSLHHIPYYLVVAPRKHRIYFDKMPAPFNAYKEDHAIADFLQELDKHPNITVINLEHTFKKKRYLHIYYKTDTHWNPLGAYIGYEETLKQLRQDSFLEDDPIPFDHAVYDISQDADGDINGILQSPGIFQRKLWKFKYLKESKSVPQDAKPEYIKSSELGPAIYLKNDDKKVKVMLHRDSYGVDYIPFFIEHFSETLALWTKSFHPQQVLDYQPDIYVQLAFERVFFEFTLPNPPLVEKELVPLPLSK